jgi:hypothetical protein
MVGQQWCVVLDLQQKYRLKKYLTHYRCYVMPIFALHLVLLGCKYPDGVSIKKIALPARSIWAGSAFY